MHMQYAQRWLFLLLMWLGLLVTHSASALEDAKLALAAAQYRQLIQDGRNAQGKTAAALIQQAQKQKKDLELALANYETAIVAGADNTVTWLALTELWQAQAQRQELDNVENEARQRAQQRAAQAAWNALQVASTPVERARALFYLGEIYDKDAEPKAALTAYREALALEDQPRFAKRYQELLAANSFKIKDVDVESDSAQPKVCLNFSDTLAKGRELHYEDYVRIEPNVPLVASAEGKQLCLEGVRHGESYQIKVRAGVPAADGQRTSSVQDFTAKVEDRKPTLGFRGATYVLPKVGSQQLPLTSVNVEQARLRVLRINDRNLLREIESQRITNLLDGYDLKNIAKRSGEEIWQGSVTLASGERNKEVTTALPMNELLSNPQPGIYIVAAQPAQKSADDDWENQATQWLVISDLGLFTLRGNDGLHVFVRSLASAEAQSGVELRLYARNNNELGKALTDKQGYVRFDPGLLRGSGGQEPAALMAFSKGDYNFLDLTKPAFDLSDRGVEGRAAPGALDAFLYSERGVYRPGETVQLMSLLRDSRAYALAEMPLTIKLFRPDEVEAGQFRVTQAALGGYHTQIPLAMNARTGTWSAKAYTDPQGTALGEVRFQVEDFVPQQLQLELNAAAKLLQPNAPTTLQVSGRFLYGAPAANLKAEAEVVLREDGNPYPDFPGYRFGLVEEMWTAQRFPLPLAGTDAQGKAQLQVNLTQTPDTTRPLQAKLRVSLFEPGGRAVSRSLDLPYRVHPFAIGIKPRFADGGVQMGQEAAFEVLVLDAQGQVQAKDGLKAKVVREEPEYYWYHEDGRWNYKLVIHDRAVLSSETLNVDAAKPALVSKSGLEWGRYRLEVLDPDSGIASSLRFNVGWFETPGQADTPDQMQVTLDQPRYSAGANAKVFLRAPFAGEVLLNVVGDRLWLSRTLSINTDGSSIDLPIAADWGPGVYITATAFRAAAEGASRGPGRAVGVAWIGLDPAPRTLQVSMDAPKEWIPRQTVNLPIKVTGLEAGQAAYLTVAAVDEGILQLTDFASPDPLRYFLGKRRLGMQLLDLYGKLIEAGGKPGTLKVGGDASARQLNASSLRTAKTVALFSGPIALDANGHASIPLTLPDFNGQLRLMAVAWDQQRFGRAEATPLVRDPIMARVDLPRFLAPQDVSTITVNVQNLHAAPGAYTLQLSAQGAVALDQPATFTFNVADSAVQNQELKTFSLRGVQPGGGLVRLQVTGPNNLHLTHDTEIAVRPAQTVVSQRHAQHLAAAADWSLDHALLAEYVPGTAQVSVSVSSKPNLNVPALLKKLDRYPYGCLEQTASRALPLLYFNQVASAWLGENATEAGLRTQVQEALQRLFNMQDAGGGFGLWGVDSQVETWLSAYAMDFVSRARSEKYFVPDHAWRSGLNYLRERLSSDEFAAAELGWRTYALYVLAREQQAAIGDLRYVHDNYLQKMPTALAQAQLGAALARYGELERAHEAFKAALVERERPQLRDYGSALRDRAAVLALLAESGLLPEQLPTLAAQVAEQFTAQRYTSTQEQSWLLLAAHALGQNSAPFNLSVNGQAVTADPFHLAPTAQQLTDKVILVNQGQQALWTLLETSGVPTTVQPPAQEGFTITRRYYTRSGEPLDPQQIKQHDLVVAVISGEAQGSGKRQALVVDLLPAGLEIENARLGHSSAAHEIAWLPQLSETLHTEIRDDRLVAALDLDTSAKRSFTLAYLLRAVTPGTYQQPAVYVEDMYQPWQFARGAMGVVQVR